MAESEGEHFSLGDFPEIVAEDSDPETALGDFPEIVVEDSDLETEVCQVCYLSIVMCNDFKKVLCIHFHLFAFGS